MGTLHRFTHTGDAGGVRLAEVRDFSGSLDNVSLSIPAGAYVTFRTYGGNYAFHLKEHINRLIITLRVAITLQNQISTVIRSSLSQYLHQVSGIDHRIRLIVPFSDLTALYILSEEIKTPDPRDYLNGVAVVTAHYERVEPDKKQTSFIGESMDLRKRISGVVNEVLLVDRNGCLLEGLSSNAFFVKDGKVFTAGAGVLEGVTRKTVLEICTHLVVPVEYSAVRLDEIPDCDEAFITSTSRGVLPVIKIDQQTIGKGFPGEITRKIMEGFTARIDEGLEAF